MDSNKCRSFIALPFAGAERCLPILVRAAFIRLSRLRQIPLAITAVDIPRSHDGFWLALSAVSQMWMTGTPDVGAILAAGVMSEVMYGQI